MKCPHCQVAIFDHSKRVAICDLANSYWDAICRICPSCARAIIELEEKRIGERHDLRIPVREHPAEREKCFLAYPRGGSQRTCPEAIAADFREACLVLHDSPKASAALSRRCLQHLLEEVAGIKARTLDQEIIEFCGRQGTPPGIAKALDSVRVVGNFAAHPSKCMSTGEIVDVAPGEAEWNLDVLEMLFDLLIVQENRAEQLYAAIDQKLLRSGRQPLKGGDRQAGKTGYAAG